MVEITPLGLAEDPPVVPPDADKPKPGDKPLEKPTEKRTDDKFRRPEPVKPMPKR